MAFSRKVEQGLEDAGYKYHCFISYPRVRNKELVKCARRVQEAIADELNILAISEPRVFLDERMIEPGSIWEMELKSALCHSLVMVAICAPIYYHPKHRWCGLEWAAMEDLRMRRLPESTLGTIIPIIFREDDNQPQIVSNSQWINISRESLLPGFYTSSKFKKLIIEIAGHVERVANALVGDSGRIVKTECGDFTLPVRSAFADCPELIQPAPFHSNG